MKKIINRIIVLVILFSVTACHEEWLDIKRDKRQVVPQTLEDLQALADNTTVMNEYSTPAIGEIASDNYYLSTEAWKALPIGELSNTYIWAEEIYDSPTGYSWNIPFELIMYANLILEGLEKIDPETDLELYENVMGSALFYRSWAFYHLAQVFCKQYDPSTAATELGIPLRLDSDVNLVSTRATVAQTYERIIHDLKLSLDYLPDQPLVKTRPGLAAANALLAKVYLQMRNYEEALKYAEASLQYQDVLIDYNTISPEATAPFVKLNEEVVFHSNMSTLMAYIIRVMHADPSLYSSYEDGDLRKVTYFEDNNGRIFFKGSYNGNVIPFSGIAVDEVYLMAAEGYARTGNMSEAMATLNHLLETRWRSGEFTPLEASNSEEALAIILEERRKSLCFRDIRWSDLRRLNQEPEHAVTLQRTVGGEVYALPPNSPRYVFPIPDEVIELTGMTQNER